MAPHVGLACQGVEQRDGFAVQALKVRVVEVVAEKQDGLACQMALQDGGDAGRILKGFVVVRSEVQRLDLVDRAVQFIEQRLALIAEGNIAVADDRQRRVPGSGEGALKQVVEAGGGQDRAGGQLRD